MVVRSTFIPFGSSMPILPAICSMVRAFPSFSTSRIVRWVTGVSRCSAMHRSTLPLQSLALMNSLVLARGASAVKHDLADPRELVDDRVPAHHEQADATSLVTAVPDRRPVKPASTHQRGSLPHLRQHVGRHGNVLVVLYLVESDRHAIVVRV